MLSKTEAPTNYNIVTLGDEERNIPANIPLKQQNILSVQPTAQAPLNYEVITPDGKIVTIPAHLTFPVTQKIGKQK